MARSAASARPALAVGALVVGILGGAGGGCFSGPPGYTSVDELVGRRVDWPSAAVRAEMRDAVDRSNQKTVAKPEYGDDFKPDREGRFHEEGGVYGLVKGKQVAAAARPGSYSDPQEQNEATAISWAPVDDPGFEVIEGRYHVHPGGEIESGDKAEIVGFTQPPGQGDLEHAADEKHVQKWVLGARSKEVYFYDETSTPDRPYQIKARFEDFFRGVP